MVPWVSMQCVIVEFPRHTHFLLNGNASNTRRQCCKFKTEVIKCQIVAIILKPQILTLNLFQAVCKNHNLKQESTETWRGRFLSFIYEKRNYNETFPSNNL